MIKILIEEFPKQRYVGRKGTDGNRCFRSPINLIVICSKILNQASNKLGYHGISRSPLRVIFILKIGKAFKENHIRESAMHEERLRD